MIPYGRQSIAQADIDAVVAVLRSDFLTQGPEIPAFEKTVAEYCGAGHAVAVGSATAALHLACLALDLQPGDTLWTVPNTFVASANCARYCGAEVDFVDIDLATGNLSIAALEEKLAAAQRTGRLPKIIVPVAFAGRPCPAAEIRRLADRYGFRIVEDASHAIGARYLGQPLGGGPWADITVFSFHPVKIVTTGEGGMALTHNAQLAERMARLRSHGITRDPGEMEGAPHGPWYYQMLELGFNYRMTDLQAALGRSQMQRLDEFIARRTALAERYDRLLAGCGLALPGHESQCDSQYNSQCTSAWHLYVIGWNEERSGMTRGEAFARLRAAGIGVNVHYIPVHLQPYYRRLGFAPGQFPQAEAHYARAISLPLHAGLRDDEQDYVAATLNSLSEERSR